MRIDQRLQRSWARSILVWGLFVFPLKGADKKSLVESQLESQTVALERVTERHQRKQVELEKFRGYAAIAKELEQVALKLEEAKKTLATLEERKTAAGDRISEVQLAFEDYRDQYRKAEREAAKGEVLDLSSTKGEGYSACEVLGVSPLHLRVRRPNGAEGIAFQELPKAIQDRFQFSDDEAGRYAAALAKSDAARAKAYREWKQAGAQEALKEQQGGSLEEQLERTQQLVSKTQKEGDQLKLKGNEWRERGLRFWKGIPAAKSEASRKSLERMASKADEKADEFYELFKAARFEVARLEAIVIELKARIAEEAQKK